MDQLGRSGGPEPALIDLSNLLPNETIIQAHTELFTSFLVTSLGNLYAFGYCFDGICGELTSFVPIATRIPTNLFVTRIFLGVWVIFLQDENNNTYVMGNNAYGQLCLPVAKTINSP